MLGYLNLLIFLGFFIFLRVSNGGFCRAVHISEIQNEDDYEEIIDPTFAPKNDNNQVAFSLKLVQPQQQALAPSSAQQEHKDFSFITPPQPYSYHGVLAAASWDGTIYGLDVKSSTVKWSFSAGSALASHKQFSYVTNEADIVTTFDEDKQQQFDVKDDQFLFCGNDWNLKAYNKKYGTKSLPKAPEEFIRNTPHISSDGSLILGSKVMTTFLVDFMTGNIIRRYDSRDAFCKDEMDALMSGKFPEDTIGIIDENQSSSVNLSVMQPAFITRTDYTLLSYEARTGKLRWNVSIAEIDALAVFLSNTPLEGPVRSTHPVMSPIKWKIYTWTSLNMNQKNQLFLPASYVSQDYQGEQFLPSLPPIQNVLAIMDVQNVQMKGAERSSCEIEQNCLAEIRETRQEHESFEKDNDSWTCYVKNPSSFIFLLFTTVVGIMIACIKNPKVIAMGWFGKHNQLNEQRHKQVDKGKKKRDRKINNRRIKVDDLIQQQTFQANTNQSFNHDKSILLHPSMEKSINDFGRVIGRMIVSDDVIDNGSNGTIIYKGYYDGRDVAIKRLVKACHETASKEIQNLIASDQHPNIVRWYGSEMDADFVYVALERCTCNLSDLVFALSNDFGIEDERTSDSQLEKINQISVLVKKLNVKLWNDHGFPSQQVLKLMKDVVTGLSHLHDLGIIHRDLKPQNVLISAAKDPGAKLSDMGLSKQLSTNKVSLSSCATGVGSSGWRAPEQLLHGRQTCAIDLFSLGCVLFFCITGGKHPFGEVYERDMNIVKGQYDLFPIVDMPEAVDLISRLLNKSSDLRPSTMDVLQHHFFWSADKRISFLKDASDRIELEDKEKQSDLLQALENAGIEAFGGTWEGKLDASLLTNIGRYRRYKYDSVRDLLRVIRNKSNHYRELPIDVQEMLGSLPDGFENYFRKRFPRLLHEVYKVLSQHCSNEEFFQKYYIKCMVNSGAQRPIQ